LSVPDSLRTVAVPLPLLLDVLQDLKDAELAEGGAAGPTRARSQVEALLSSAGALP